MTPHSAQERTQVTVLGKLPRTEVRVRGCISHSEEDGQPCLCPLILCLPSCTVNDFLCFKKTNVPRTTSLVPSTAQAQCCHRPLQLSKVYEVKRHEDLQVEISLQMSWQYHTGHACDRVIKHARTKQKSERYKIRKPWVPERTLEGRCVQNRRAERCQ